MTTLVLFIYYLYTIYLTRLASKEIFSPSNKIHRAVSWAKDLSAPLYLHTYILAHIYILVYVCVCVYIYIYGDNIKMDLQEVGGGCEDWMELAQDRDRWRALVSAVMNLRVPKNAGNFLTSCRTT